LDASLNIIKVIKSRRMRWAGMQHAWKRWEMYIILWVVNLKGRDHSEDLSVVRKIIRIYLRETGEWLAQWYRAGLRAEWSEVQVPAGAGNYSPHHRVQTGSGGHPISYLIGARGPFSGAKAAGSWSWPLTSI
jgi:hypothetical protein